MYNLVYLIGRITKLIDNGVDLAVQRNYKNEQNTYDTDFFKIITKDKILENVKEYCQKGDLIGIRGRLETKDNEMLVVADKVSFLSTKRENDNKKD